MNKVENSKPVQYSLSITVNGNEVEFFIGGEQFIEKSQITEYIQVIEQLINCTEEQALEIVKANKNLLSLDFLKAMKEIAENILISMGEFDSAERLLNLRGWLALKVEDFLVETLRLINKTEADLEQVHAFLEKHQNHLNVLLLQGLPRIMAPFLKGENQELVASNLINFGTLVQQFLLGTRWLNLELAIVAADTVLKTITCEKCPELWATAQNCLANAYRDRIREDKLENLRKSIDCARLSLVFYSKDKHLERWAIINNNLAHSLIEIAAYNGTAKILDAMSICIDVLESISLDDFPQQWGRAQSNFADACSEAFFGKRDEYIEFSLHCYMLSLQAYTFNTFPHQWAGTCNNLSLLYSKRIEANRKDNLELAIVFAQKSLSVFTEDFPEYWAMAQHSLAIAYSLQVQEGLEENRKLSICSFISALKVYTHDVFPKQCLRASRGLGNLYFEGADWQSAVDVYDNALSAANILYQSCSFLDSRSVELKEIDDLHRRMTYALARINRLPKAIETLEISCARGLSESLDRDRANLNQLQQRTPHLYKRYQGIINQIRNLESQQRDHMASDDRNNLVPKNLRNDATKLRSELEETITQIRQISGYEDFMTPTKWENIKIAPRSDNPLLYLVTTPNGGMVLTVSVDAIEVLWLNDLKEKILREILYGSAEEKELSRWLGAYQDFRNDSKTNYPAWCKEIDTTTRQLWDSLMGPIVQHLKTLGYDRATLIPTGYLSLLPLHAAWTEDPTTPTGRRYALDDIHFTYTPNARSLTAAREIANRPQVDSILAIDDPSHGLPSIQTLHNSQREIDCAIDTFTDRTVLRHDEATIDAVQAGLAEASIVHFSCHGTANFTDPLNSGLLMSDGLLTLKDLLALNLAKDNGIRLAILSACETGLPGLDNIDEVVSLPVGLMQAGVAGVIASLWSVSDLSTMLLLTKFYELWREQHIPADQALRQAQIWLRDSTNDEKVIEFQTAIDRTRMSPATAQQLHKKLAWKPENERSFAHPYYWAAFSYTGI
jgi:CHAT domain-containing protein